MKFTKIPEDTFEKLQMNVGILVSSFNPETETIGDLLGATTGGITFNSNPTYSDYGEDIDNCPNNMKELKKLTSFDPTMSGTFLSIDAQGAKDLIASADIDSLDSTHIVPRKDLTTTDFKDVWWIGDYSDVNTGSSAGFMAIHLKNALNTSGLSITTTKDGKGQMAFEYHAHYTMDAQEEVPFEVYIKQGE